MNGELDVFDKKDIGRIGEIRACPICNGLGRVIKVSNESQILWRTCLLCNGVGKVRQ